MQRLVTTVAGPLFWIGVSVGGLIILWYLIDMWKRFYKTHRTSIDAGQLPPSWLGHAIMTIVAVGAYVLCATVVWNAMQSATTSASNYITEAERNYKQQLVSSNSPTNEQLDQTKVEMKNRAEVQPHQKALDDFDAKMQAEADKIRQRSLGITNQPGVEKK